MGLVGSFGEDGWGGRFFLCFFDYIFNVFFFLMPLMVFIMFLMVVYNVLMVLFLFLF